jgi:hypothetical protein
VLNLGGELMLSPIRVLKSPLPSGVLQHLMMRQRAEYNGLPGPRSTRAQRLVPRTRERRMFTQKVVGISPPLLLQSRDPARSQDVLEQCKQVRCSGQAPCRPVPLLFEGCLVIITTCL